MALTKKVQQQRKLTQVWSFKLGLFLDSSSYRQSLPKKFNILTVAHRLMKKWLEEQKQFILMTNSADTINCTKLHRCQNARRGFLTFSPWGGGTRGWKEKGDIILPDLWHFVHFEKNVLNLSKRFSRNRNASNSRKKNIRRLWRKKNENCDAANFFLSR